MGIFKSLSDVLGKIIGDLFAESGFVDALEDVWDAISPFKIGRPISEGERFAINSYVRDEHYNGDESLGDVYDDIKDWDEFKGFSGTLRHGWLAEFMAESYAGGAWEELVFLWWTARLNMISEFARNFKNMFAGKPGSPPAGVWQTFLFAPMWIAMFFNAGTVVVGGLMAGDFAVLNPAYQTWALLFYLSYTKWYGKYGMWLPGMGTQTFPSALFTVLLDVFTIGVIGRLFGLGDVLAARFRDWPYIWAGFNQWIGDGLVTLSPLALFDRLLRWSFDTFNRILIFWTEWMFGIIEQIPFGTLFLETPWLLGLGPMVGTMDWATLLMYWGIAGAANLLYGEYIESKREEIEFNQLANANVEW